MAFALYQACILENVPRSLREVASMWGVREKDLGGFEAKLGGINRDLSHSFLSRADILLSENQKRKISRLVSLFTPFSSASPTSILCSAFYITQRKKLSNKKDH